MAAQTAVAETASPFVASLLDVGGQGRQVVLPGAFHTAGQPELLVITMGDKGRRTGRLYQLDNDLSFGTAPVREMEIDPGAIIVDTGRLGDRDAIVWIVAGSVLLYDPLDDTVRRLVQTPSIYSVPMKIDLPRIDFFRDLTDDGLDDLVIPTFEGYRVFVQKAGGEFEAPVLMDAPPLMDMSFDNHPWYQPRVLFNTDLSGDGLADVVFWAEDRFRVYPRIAGGGFSSTPIYVASSVAFEFDGVDGMSATLRDGDQSNLDLTALFRLRDLDGDLVPELVTFTIRSSGVFKKETTFRIYRGIPPAPGGPDDKPRFSREPTSVIESRGVQFESDEVDLSGDGQIDFVISSVRLGIGKIIGALLTGSVDYDLDFYSMKDGVYRGGPTVSREVTASFDLSSGDTFFPFVLFADLTGDNVKELLVQEGLDTIRIYRGRPDDRLFASDSIDVKLRLPIDADLVSLDDINRDGRQDVIMRLESKTGPSSVMVLITKPVF